MPTYSDYFHYYLMSLPVFGFLFFPILGLILVSRTVFGFRQKRSWRRRLGWLGFYVAVCWFWYLFLFGSMNIRKSPAEKARDAKIAMGSFEQALQAYYVKNGIYPNTQQGLRALVERPSSGKVPANYPAGGFLTRKSLAKDPWGRDYSYWCDDYQNYHLSSAGENGILGDKDDVIGE